VAVYYSRKLWHNRKKGSWFQVEEINSSNLKNGQLLIYALFSMISAGTERRVITHPPRGKAARYMRVPYMQGNFANDFTYGYSMVGKVIGGSRDWLGKIVHVMHPHQEFLIVDIQDVFPVPDSLNPKIATLASNLETAVNAVWDSGITLGDRILIVGFGIIGTLLALIIRRIPGIELKIFELDLYRVKKGEDLNLQITSDESELSGEYTIAFNTSSSESGIQLAIDQVGLEGKIVELSWFGPQKINLNFGNDFHYYRKRIISSQVSHLPASKSYQFNYRSRKKLVFKILKEISFDNVIGEIISFGKAPEFYEKLKEGKIQETGILFHYNKT
jgi:threonine dehydrogenase-like Zn-dependent dehydrogenase